VVGPFALDGYDVLAPLGPSGRSWRAVCLADGGPVVLRRCAGAGAHVAEVRRRAAVWGSVVGAGLVAVRDVVCQGDDLVVVTDLAVGGGLDALLARHGGFSAGQVVTLVVGVAETLTRAHAAGLTHGRLSAGNVVLDADGRPLLTDYMFGGSADSAADVASLCALAGVDPYSDARSLVDTVRGALPAEPLMSASGPSDPVIDDVATGTRNRAAVLLVAAAVSVAVLAGVTWGRHDRAAGAVLPAASASPSPTAPAVSWRAVISDVEARRAHALATANTVALGAAVAPGTALWRHDRRVLTRLIAAHEQLRGLQPYVRSVHVVSLTTNRVVARVIDALSSYDVVDNHGVAIAHRAARSPRAVVLVLEHLDQGWLLRRVISQRLR
jgi:hypothetical protein